MSLFRPLELEHGERFSKLTVLEKLRKYNGGVRYRVGCSCGHSGMVVTAGALMSGRKKACKKCESLAEGDLETQRRLHDKWATGNAIAKGVEHE